MKKTLLALALVGLTLSGCGDTNTAVRAAESAGLRNVTITGNAWMGCGTDDDFGRHFTGVNALGKRVEGTACWGWFKGATVRFN